MPGLAPISFPAYEDEHCRPVQRLIGDPDTSPEPTLQDAFTEGFAQVMEWISGQPRQQVSPATAMGPP
jgi:hypothetical protein